MIMKAKLSSMKYEAYQSQLITNNKSVFFLWFVSNTIKYHLIHYTMNNEHACWYRVKLLENDAHAKQSRIQWWHVSDEGVDAETHRVVGIASDQPVQHDYWNSSIQT